MDSRKKEPKLVNISWNNILILALLYFQKYFFSFYDEIWLNQATELYKQKSK